MLNWLSYYRNVINWQLWIQIWIRETNIIVHNIFLVKIAKVHSLLHTSIKYVILVVQVKSGVQLLNHPQSNPFEVGPLVMTVKTILYFNRKGTSIEITKVGLVRDKILCLYVLCQPNIFIMYIWYLEFQNNEYMIIHNTRCVCLIQWPTDSLVTWKFAFI